MSLFKGRYRNETTRLRTWDYGANAYYFVTICTQAHEHFLGEVSEAMMHLSDIGEAAAAEWLKTSDLRPYVKLDAWVIMPNHMHGILIVDKDNEPNVGIGGVAGTRTIASVPPSSTTPPVDGANRFGPLKKDSLQSIIRGYKSAVTTWCRKNDHPEFAWQARYYEHIIRTEKALANIREYIANNPAKWAYDQANQPGAWM